MAGVARFSERWGRRWLNSSTKASMRPWRALMVWGCGVWAVSYFLSVW